MVETLFTRLSSKPTMLVLGLPRTGTKTMLHFLHANYADRYEVCHSHGLSDSWTDVLRDHWADAPASNGEERGKKWIEHKLASRARTIAFLRNSPFVLVAVTVRDPIARAYSAMVYRHEASMRNLFDNDTNSFRELPIVRALVDRCARQELEVQRTWFDRELRRPFGIDVLAHNSQKWPVIIEAKRTTFLLTKCEDIDRMIDQIRRKISGGEHIVYQPKNSSAQRQTRAILDAVISQAPIEPKLVRKMYELPEVRHLYTAREIANFRAQWQRCAA